MDRMTKEQRHRCMSRIRSKDTKPEILLRKKLWSMGIRYRKNYKKLVGRPDIAITRYRIAIFVDGDFWHGRDSRSLERIQTRHSYWVNKICRNKERDVEVNELLTSQGWLVLRFWATDIMADLDGCIRRILIYLPYVDQSN